MRARLKNLLPFDTHAGENGQYTHPGSLYFDDYNDSCLGGRTRRGWTTRRKYRIRLYNGSPTACSWRSNANATA